MTDETFAARLALVRNRMQWNAKEAALACSLPPSSWLNWEEGMMPRNLKEVAWDISQRTGCDFGWLAIGVPSGPVDSPFSNAPLAQLAEQLTLNQRISGPLHYADRVVPLRRAA